MLAVRIQAIDGTRTFTLLDSQPCRPLPSPPPHTARPVSRELPVDPYRNHRWGFPCCVWSPMRTCRRHYPGRFHRACSLVPLHGQRPSLCNSQVGSCNCFFGACSAFTHVTACTLAESLYDPLHRKLRQLRCLCCRFDCYRVERTSSRAGVSPAEVQRLSRRTITSTDIVTPPSLWLH
jgi:AraC-like DNA-binding protein